METKIKKQNLNSLQLFNKKTKEFYNNVYNYYIFSNKNFDRYTQGQVKLIWNRSCRKHRVQFQYLV